jgi:nucleotide-binding universal stress UspA family protein
MSKTYIVPVDGSALSETALPWARRLAELNAAKIVLLRTVPAPFTMFAGPEPIMPAHELDASGFKKQVAEYLERKVDEFPKGTAHFEQTEGEPADAILELSESDGVEAILMASHGRGGLGRWLLGSVATKVVRGSEVPVFVVNAHTNVAPTPTARRILVPLDGSELSEKAVPKALELAEKLDSDVVLYRSILPGGLESMSMEQAIAAGKEVVENYLAEVADRYPDARIETIATFDQPAQGIVKQSESCDLIVMGSHGRSGVRRWMLGSVSERIIQEAYRPVMLVYDR